MSQPIILCIVALFIGSTAHGQTMQALSVPPETTNWDLLCQSILLDILC